ncbi:MAG: hypothetical protein JW929_16520 [Anaerolineales bacterium]|nr:hypothetical protein [Anaerolineales bacterium]
MIHRPSLRRKALVAAVAVLAALALSAPREARAAATAKQLSTNFTLVNLDRDNPAAGAISYLLESGADWPGVSAGNLSFNLPANGGSIQIKQYFDPTMQPGRGSVVIAADRPVGAIVQIQARGQTPTQGAYTGFLEGHSVYYVPLVARNRFTLSGTGNSEIIIQNADAEAVTVTVDLVPNAESSGAYTRTIDSIQPGVSYYYDLTEETNLPDNWIGSAVVTALGSRKITVVSNFYQGPDILQTYNAFPAEDLGPEWIVPIFFSRLENGLSTVITVQNIGGAEIAAGALAMHCATIWGNDPGELDFTNPTAIAPNGSYSFNPIGDAQLYPVAWAGTCEVEASGADLAAIVQMRYYGSPTGNIGASAYEAVKAGGTDRVMFVPLVAKVLPNGFASVVGVRNLGDSTTALRLIYIPATNGNCPVGTCDINRDGIVDAADTIIIEGLVIPGGSSLQRNHRLGTGTSSAEAENALPNNWEGSLRIESSSQPIDGYVQLTYYKNVSGDQFMAHRVFTRALP